MMHPTQIRWAVRHTQNQKIGYPPYDLYVLILDADIICRLKSFLRCVVHYKHQYFFPSVWIPFP